MTVKQRRWPRSRGRWVLLASLAIQNEGARIKITHAWREGNRHSSEYDTFKLMSRELRTPILWLLALIYISLVEFML